MNCLSAIARIFAVLVLHSVVLVQVLIAQTNSESKNPIDIALALLKNTRTSSGLIGVNSSNAASYRALMSPELYALVRAGLMELQLASSLHYEWTYGDEWSKPRADSERLSAPAEGSARMPDPFRPGFLFGPAQTLASESDPQLRATQVLWNFQSVLWSMRLIDADFSLLWFKEGKLAGQARGTQTRVYPGALQAAEKSDQLFREVMHFRSPEVLASLAWLTIRSFGQDEDYLWMNSPAIKKGRQLTGSNRADSIMRTSISLDDFLLWSGKPESVEATVVKSSQLLVPFTGIDASQWVQSQTQASCGEVKEPSSAESAFDDGGRPEVDMKRFPPATIPLRAGTVFVPTEVWRLELMPKDPFSMYARQMIYVDVKSMLPVYKVVYDRGGQIWKIGIGVIGLAKAEKQGRPYYSQVIMYDRLKNEYASLYYERIAYCDGYTDSIKAADFDPRKLSEESQDLQKIQQEKKSAPPL